ncbi:MAG: integrase arm-type DNA-binding domain-containing protein [Sulfuricaulis sp.]
MTSTFSVNQSVKLTKLVVDKTPLPSTGQIILRDTELKGFGLRVTAGGAKSFILEKRIKGRVRRLTLGRYPGITAEQARKEVQKLLGNIITGHDPVAERAQARIQGITLAQAFDDFLKTRANLKERTKYDYRRLMKVAFPNWAKKPLTSITKDLVARRHGELGEARGKAYANLSMRFLRALLNFARAQYEDPSGNSILFDNPVARLTHTRAWYRIDRRQTVIKPNQLPAWYQAVEDLKAGRLKFKGRPIFVHSEIPENALKQTSVDYSSHSSAAVRMLDISTRIFIDKFEKSLNNIESAPEPRQEILDKLSIPNTAETVADYLW